MLTLFHVLLSLLAGAVAIVLLLACLLIALAVALALASKQAEGATRKQAWKELLWELRPSLLRGKRAPHSQRDSVLVPEM